MYYDVLINYCGLDETKPLWSRLSKVKTFSLVISLFKKEIPSHEYFIYVRKVFTDKQSDFVATNFKLITSLSYTFAHYPSSPTRNKYLVEKFNKLEVEYDKC